MEVSPGEKIVGFEIQTTATNGNVYHRFRLLEKKLVFELDGGQHAINLEKDKMRDFWLEEQGFRVLHIWDSDVFSNIHGVLQTIMTDCSGKQED